MSMRGEFRRGDGLVIPNNITKAGVEAILRAAFQGEPLTLWMGLANAVPDPEIQIEDLNEPEIGVNGYARVELTQDDESWPTLGLTNDEVYIESKSVVFEAAGGEFTEAVTRVALLLSATDTTGSGVLSLSSALPFALTIDPDTPIAQRTFTYRLYLR